MVTPSNGYRRHSLCCARVPGTNATRGAYSEMFSDGIVDLARGATVTETVAAFHARHGTTYKFVHNIQSSSCALSISMERSIQYRNDTWSPSIRPRRQILTDRRAPTSTVPNCTVVGDGGRFHGSQFRSRGRKPILRFLKRPKMALFANRAVILDPGAGVTNFTSQ